MRSHNRYLLFSLLCLSACHNAAPPGKPVRDTTAPATSPVADTAHVSDVDLQKDRKTILGRWVSNDDPKSGLEFEQDKYYSVYDGARVDTNRYTISHKNCEGGADPRPVQDDEYLKATQTSGEAFCYAITSLDEHSLALMYAGSGNGSITTYHRAQ